MLIRIEKEDDKAAVYQINAAAFETTAEANLVDVLREQAEPTISLVAENDATVIGHIMCSPVTVYRPIRTSRLTGLAPMAVITHTSTPGHRLSACSGWVLSVVKRLGFRAVVVLGPPRILPAFWLCPGFSIQPAL